MADPKDPTPEGAPRHIHVERDADRKGVNWLAWLLLALGILALLLALSRCGRNEPAAVVPVGNETAAVSNDTAVVAQTSDAPRAEVLNGVSGLGTYLGGSGPTPQTFTFEKVNFDSAKSAIRPADQAEIDQVAGVLKQYGTASVRIAGYADSRGADPANVTLGKARADSVKAALVAKGIAAGRIQTVSGGETDPVDSNATATGRFENRRTELVVTSR